MVLCGLMLQKHFTTQSRSLPLTVLFAITLAVLLVIVGAWPVLKFLTMRRSEAIRAARRAGAIVHGMPSMRTTVVVRGRPNPLQAAGRDAGLKLMEIKRLREKGHRITLLNESQFWRLAARKRAMR